MSYLFLTVVSTVIFFLPFVLIVLLFVEIAKTENKKTTAIAFLFLVLVGLLGLWANRFGGTFGSFLFLIFTLTMCSGKESK